MSERNFERGSATGQGHDVHLFDDDRDDGRHPRLPRDWPNFDQKRGTADGNGDADDGTVDVFRRLRDAILRQTCRDCDSTEWDAIDVDVRCCRRCDAVRGFDDSCNVLEAVTAFFRREPCVYCGNDEPDGFRVVEETAAGGKPAIVCTECQAPYHHAPLDQVWLLSL